MRSVRQVQLAVLCLVLAGCMDEVDPSLRAPADSAAGAQESAAGAAGDVASAPAEVGVTLQDCSVTLGSSSVAAGTVAFQVSNQGGTQQELVVRGPGGDFPSGPIPAGAAATMSLVLTTGTYTLGCAAGTAVDSAATPATLTVH